MQWRMLGQRVCVCKKVVMGRDYFIFFHSAASFILVERYKWRMGSSSRSMQGGMVEGERDERWHCRDLVAQ